MLGVVRFDPEKLIGDVVGKEWEEVRSQLVSAGFTDVYEYCVEGGNEGLLLCRVYGGGDDVEGVSYVREFLRLDYGGNFKALEEVLGDQSHVSFIWRDFFKVFGPLAVFVRFVIKADEVGVPRVDFVDGVVVGCPRIIKRFLDSLREGKNFVVSEVEVVGSCSDLYKVVSGLLREGYRPAYWDDVYDRVPPLVLVYLDDVTTYVHGPGDGWFDECDVDERLDDCYERRVPDAVMEFLMFPDMATVGVEDEEGKERVEFSTYPFVNEGGDVVILTLYATKDRCVIVKERLVLTERPKGIGMRFGSNMIRPKTVKDREILEEIYGEDARYVLEP